MTDGSDASSGTKGVSDTAFFVGTGLTVLLLVIGVAFFLLRSGGDAGTTVPGTSQPLPLPSPTSPRAGQTQPPTAGAVALVRKSFRLSSAGEFAAACALESPAYRKFDAAHYPGGCEGGSRAAAKALAARGLSMRLIGVRVSESSGSGATVLARSSVGTRVVTQHIYVTYHAGRWWISGSDDSADLGY